MEIFIVYATRLFTNGSYANFPFDQGDTDSKLKDLLLYKHSWKKSESNMIIATDWKLTNLG